MLCGREELLLKYKWMRSVVWVTGACWMVAWALVGLAVTPAAAAVRIGILHSQSGTMASSEKPVIAATRLAVRQINAAGGLLGEPVEVVVADGRSDEQVFAAQAERLLTQEHVDALFGCWTSASRKAVKPVVERHHGLLFYPVQYEGMEQSPNIIYVGAAPNQQIVPAVSWAVQHLGKRVYLVGSDYIFPRVANWIIRQQLQLLGATVVAERYLPLGSRDMRPVIADIQASHPDLILNTINGDSNFALFHALKQAGLSAATLPVLSFSISEAAIQHMPVAEIAGHYAAWNYFQSIDSEKNRDFVQAIRHEAGVSVVSDPMEAAWMAVHLWARAVRAAQTADPQVIRHSVLLQSMAAPEGVVSIDPRTRHAWRTAYIGRVNEARQFNIIWYSDHAIKPMPYPLFVDRYRGEQLIRRLHQQWHGAWSAPAVAR